MVASSLAGLVGGAMIFYFMAKVLLPGERIMDPADYQLEGTVAQVTVPLRGQAGEILYTKAGTRRSEGARTWTATPSNTGRKW